MDNGLWQHLIRPLSLCPFAGKTHHQRHFAKGLSEDSWGKMDGSGKLWWLVWIIGGNTISSFTFFLSHSSSHRTSFSFSSVLLLF
jgi:hypothetical protein